MLLVVSGVCVPGLVIAAGFSELAYLPKRPAVGAGVPYTIPNNECSLTVAASF